jgi:hypothetical protein
MEEVESPHPLSFMRGGIGVRCSPLIKERGWGEVKKINPTPKESRIYRNIQKQSQKI